MKRRSFLQIAAVSPLLAQAPKQPARTEWIAWVGTYTRGKSKGIYAYRWNPAEHKSTELGLAGESSNPSFLAVHPNQQFLYAVNEDNKGMVSAFGIDPQSGQLKPLAQVSSRGSGPCHVAVDHTGHWAYAANYNSGSIAGFPVHSDGALGESSVFVQHSGSSVNKSRQGEPHAHATVLSPDNRHLLVADLGMDEVLAYPVDPSAGGLNVRDPAVAKLTPGSGPRHLAFRPDAKFVYVLSELTATVTSFRYSPARALFEDPQTISALPDGYNGPKSGAEIAIHGNHLYTSNRGHNSIAAFRIDPASGHLTLTGHTPTQGKTPRNFAIDPSGGYLLAANQDSDNIVIFKIDPHTGGLTPTGEVWNVGAPVCIVFSAVK